MSASASANVYIVLGAAAIGGAWGRGSSRQEALAAAKENGLESSRGYTVLCFPSDSTFESVDMFGNVRYTGAAPISTTVGPSSAHAVRSHQAETGKGQRG